MFSYTACPAELPVRQISVPELNSTSRTPGRRLAYQFQYNCIGNCTRVWTCRCRTTVLDTSVCMKPTRCCASYFYRVSHELRSLLRESVPYVKIYRYNPKHLYPKLNGYGDNGQRKLLTSCISAYCTSSAINALTLTEQCSRPLCECTSYAQHDKIVLHYCRIFMLYVQCLVTLRTTMTWVRVFLYFNLMALCHSQVSLMLSTDINITETTYSCQF